MELQETKISEITDRTERANYKLARIARNDCVHGGAYALVLIKRLTRLHSKVDTDIVARQYHRNYQLGEDGAYYCPECGEPIYGMDAAYNHCKEIE